jgi:conjugative transfer signal peptidase TraF
VKRLGRRIAIGTALTGGGVLLFGLACLAAGACINTTGSIPVGLYWTRDRPVARGAYVQFCPPQRPMFDEARQRGYLAAGFCPGNYGYLMKRVLAVPGDTVALNDDGVRVNGRLLPFSAPVAHDRAGRPLQPYRTGRFTLGRSAVLLMSDVSPTSFDGRYFGPIDLRQVRSVITPVVTW